MSKRIILTDEELYALRELIQDEFNKSTPYSLSKHLGEKTLHRLQEKLAKQDDKPNGNE